MSITVGLLDLTAPRSVSPISFVYLSWPLARSRMGPEGCPPAGEEDYTRTPPEK